ncbi:hypothetical protein U9M48_038636 [Paspalum notatum var. saurae]|uniref:Uncharacterized protein n=1 Tax=Paspalum notatum var. saurae TaxID=547442 RepID=A0AAQ3XAI8_PASNO
MLFPRLLFSPALFPTFRAAAAARVPTMAEDSGAILRHISSLKDMLDKVNEEIEQNIQKTREIESEIVKHSETEKHYLEKESELMKEVSIAEFELNGLIQFINESKGFQANMLGSSNDNLVLLLKEKCSLEDESEILKMKINTIDSSSKEYIAEILEEVNTENSVLESELQYKISEYMDVLKDIKNLKILFSSIYLVMMKNTCKIATAILMTRSNATFFVSSVITIAFTGFFKEDNRNKEPNHYVYVFVCQET